MSMKPGARIRPVPSICRAAVSLRRASTAEMRPSRTATSSNRGGLPVPSMTVAPRTIKSSMCCLSSSDLFDVSKGRKETMSPDSLDHLVGKRAQIRGNLQAKRLGSLEIDHKFEAGRHLNRQFDGICATKNPIDI